MNWILYISHDATRTGAPIIFLNFLKWFQANTKIPFQILLKNGGELHLEFEKLAPTYTLNPDKAHNPSETGLLKRLLGKKIANPINTLENQLAKKQIALIYSNTITNGKVLERLGGLSCPVLTHVHELDYWIRYRVNPKDLELVRRYTHRYIAVSHAVKEALVGGFDIPADKIDVIHGFIPTQDFRPTISNQSIREQLNIPENAFVVGASGTTDWRKGPDLFIQLAFIIRKLVPVDHIHFIWIGGQHSGPEYGKLRHDLERAGLQNQVHFLGTKQHPADYFNSFDLFASVSREDPFPLVALEAAYLHKPIVAFDRGGGIKEFIQEDCGYVVPYLDLDEMAQKILYLLNNPEHRKCMGDNAHKRVIQNHSINIVGPKILEIIEQLL